MKGPGGAWQRTGLWDFVQTRSISEQAVSLYVTLSCISVSKFNTCCIYSHPQKCPSGGHLRFPRNFLALKIVGKAQECDLSVTGHPTVDKRFRWLMSFSVLGCFLKHPQHAHWPYLQSHHQPTQMLSNRHIRGWILLAGFYRKVSWLAALTKQSLFLTLTRSHLWEMQLFPASIPLWIPKLPEAVRQLVSQKRDKHRSSISHQILWRAVARCSGLCWFGAECLQQPPGCPAPLGSWSPEPRDLSWDPLHIMD